MGGIVGGCTGEWVGGWLGRSVCALVKAFFGPRYVFGSTIVVLCSIIPKQLTKIRKQSGFLTGSHAPPSPSRPCVSWPALSRPHAGYHAWKGIHAAEFEIEFSTLSNEYHYVSKSTIYFKTPAMTSAQYKYAPALLLLCTIVRMEREGKASKLGYMVYRLVQTQPCEQQELLAPGAAASGCVLQEKPLCSRSQNKAFLLQHSCDIPL